MLALAVVFLGYGLPLNHWSAHGRELPTARTPKQRAERRAPLAEHGWERRVLCNLTRSD